MKAIRAFCGVERGEVDDKYNKELEALNEWYWEETGNAYTRSCVKELEARKKKDKYDEEIERICEEYEDELDEIYLEYIKRENEIHDRYVMRQLKKQK